MAAQAIVHLGEIELARQKQGGPMGPEERKSFVGVQEESKYGLVKVTRRQQWTDLISASVDPKMTDKQPNTVLVAL